MDLVLGWVFVFTFLSKIILSTSDIEVKYGRFSVLRQHPKLRRCADEVLKENKYVGGRISDQTGVCEGLSPSVWRNQTIEPGYGYVKKTYVQQNLEPPIPEPSFRYKNWTIPIFVDPGARVDVHIIWPPTWMVYASYILFSEWPNPNPVMFEMSLHGVFSGMAFRETDKFELARSTGLFNKEPLPAAFVSIVSPKECKISFIAKKNNSLQILVDDDVVKTVELSIVRVNYLRQMKVEVIYGNVNGKGFLLRGFEYTEA